MQQLERSSIRSVSERTDTFELSPIAEEACPKNLGPIPKIWKLVFDLPGEKVNILNRKVISEFGPLFEKIEKLGKEGQIEALVFVSGKPGSFIAGADIGMLSDLKTKEEAKSLSQVGQNLFNRWEDLPFPTVAAIQGAALGGGCELALACSAIVMAKDTTTRIGLPEVQLGLLPGSGGCIRMPQKIGLSSALDLILTGRALDTDRAYRMGLIEANLPKENFLTSAIQWVCQNYADLKAGKRIAKVPKLGATGGVAGKLIEQTPFGRSFLFSKAKQGVMKKTAGLYPAPLEIIQVIRESGVGYGAGYKAGCNGSKKEERKRAMEIEASGFGKLAVTDQAKNLMYLFFLMEKNKKSTGTPVPLLKTSRIIESAGVVGAGIMGGGIAELLAEKNIPVRMKDLAVPALELGVQSCVKIFQRNVQKKKITSRGFIQKLNKIQPTLDYVGFQKLDLVIEAVVENKEVKRKVLEELESQVSGETILATNTSSLSVSELQKTLQKPERFVGMHFFNPVNKMPLVEVIRGHQSSDLAVASVFQLVKTLGKTPIVVKDSPGFLVNRLLAPYLNEAAFIFEEGVEVDVIDSALEKFGMPMGPLELMDEVGLDVVEKVGHIMGAALGDRMKPSELSSKMVQLGRLGKKNSKGFYVYDPLTREKTMDLQLMSDLNINTRSESMESNTIVDRCILLMINEACRCLEEEVVKEPGDIDLGMIMGTGFPPFTGGLFRYAQSLGYEKIKERLSQLSSQLGNRFEPAAAISRYIS